MNRLWIIAFFAAVLATDVSFFTVSAVRVLNINWKCTDGAPCLNVVRPRGGVAIVKANVDAFKLEISVHRQEGEREEVLQKWSSSPFTSWDVEVTWFRLVERRVRIPMHQCKDKVICMTPLLDDEAIANSDHDFGKANMLSHHFQVSVNYKGHKPASSTEIVIEREVLDSPTSRNGAGVAYGSQEGILPQDSAADALSPGENSAQDAEEVEPFGISDDSSAADDEDAAVIAGDKKHRSQGFLTKTFSRLGPTWTIVILLAVSILVSFCCVCGVNRYNNFRPSDKFRYHKLNPDSSKKGISRKAKGRRKERGARGAFNSITSLLKYRKKDKFTPKMSAATGSENASAQDTTRLLDCETGGENDSGDDDDDDDDDDDGEGMAAGIYRSIKEAGSKVFYNIKNAAEKSHTFIKGVMQNNGFFLEENNAADDKWPETFFVVLWPYRYVWQMIRESHTYRRIRKEVNTKISEFLPNRDLARGSEEDEANDEVNLLYRRETRKQDSPPPPDSMPGSYKPRECRSTGGSFTPMTDISGRFYPGKEVKTSPDSTEKSGRKYGYNVMFPSGRAPDGEESQTGIVGTVVASLPAPSPPQQQPQGHQCTCHLNSGDTVATTSPLCRNESLHSPRKQRCGLHCIRQQKSALISGRSSLPRPPAYASLPPRISRTPPPDHEAPLSAASSEAAGPARNHGHARSSSSSSSETAGEPKNGGQPAARKQDLQRGDASSSNMTVLERTKYFFRRENEHMEALLQSWEERTNGRTHANGRGRNRSRAWLAHRRDRRRELSLQQEAKQLPTPPNSKDARPSVAHDTSGREKSAASEVRSTVWPPTRLLPQAGRLNMPRIENASQQRSMFSQRPQTATNQSATGPLKIFPSKRSAIYTGPERRSPRCSKSNDTLGTSSTCDTSSVEEKKLPAHGVTQTNKSAGKEAKGIPRPSKSDDTLGTSSECDSCFVEENENSLESHEEDSAIHVAEVIFCRENVVDDHSQSVSSPRAKNKLSFSQQSIVNKPQTLGEAPVISSPRDKNKSAFPLYSVVNKAKKSRHTEPDRATHYSPRRKNMPPGRRKGDFAEEHERLSAPSSPRKLRTSNMDHISASNVSPSGTPPPVPPKLFDVREYMDEHDLASGRSHVQRPSPRRTLNSAALAFLQDEQSDDSFSTEEDEDELWRVNL